MLSNVWTLQVTAEVTAALEASHRTQVLGELKLKQTQAAQDLIKESKLACAVSHQNRPRAVNFDCVEQLELPG